MTVGLLDRRLLFVTGKGGAGKSTVAAALGLLAAQRGKRTLLCEVDAKGNLADFLETARPGFTPRQVQPHLWAMAMDTEASLQEYLRLQLRVPAIARLGPMARALDFVATAAPGVREILTVGKIGWEVRERHYDLVVVDASASGHVIGQLTAPEAINEMVKVGQVRHQTGWLIELLSDPAVTGAVVVATPEETPVNEAIELVERIGTETAVDVAAVVVNRVLPELFSHADEEVFERLREPGITGALTELVAGISGGAGVENDPTAARGRQAHSVEAIGGLSGGAGVENDPTAARGRQAHSVEADTGPVATVLEAARLAVTLRRTRSAHLERLRAEIDATLALLFVPELFARTHGLRATAMVADALSAELDQ